MLLYDIFESWLCDLFKSVMILSLASLSSDTDSRTVNIATLTVWRLGTSQYYVHVKLF